MLFCSTVSGYFKESSFFLAHNWQFKVGKANLPDPRNRVKAPLSKQALHKLASFCDASILYQTINLPFRNFLFVQTEYFTKILSVMTAFTLNTPSSQPLLSCTRYYFVLFWSWPQLCQNWHSKVMYSHLESDHEWPRFQVIHHLYTEDKAFYLRSIIIK